ncbi:MAG: hypothetical protein H7839_04375 [Magnetococcus sp. YQC-5]
MAPKKIHDTPSTRVMAYRKRRMEGMKRVEIWLADDELEQLDVVVEETGISRARVVALLLKEYIEKNASLVPVTLPSVDLPSVDLPSVDLPSVDLPSVDLPSVDLPSVDLPSVDLPSVEVCESGDPTESPGFIPASDQEESPPIMEASITLSANMTQCETDKPTASTQVFIPTSDLNEPTDPSLLFPTSDREASPRTLEVCEPNTPHVPILASDKDASPTVTKTSDTIQPTPAPIAPPQPTKSQDFIPARHQTVQQQPPLQPRITLPGIFSSDPLKNRTQRGQMVFLASLQSLKNKTD